MGWKIHLNAKSLHFLRNFPGHRPLAPHRSLAPGSYWGLRPQTPTAAHSHSGYQLVCNIWTPLGVKSLGVYHISICVQLHEYSMILQAFSPTHYKYHFNEFSQFQKAGLRSFTRLKFKYLAHRSTRSRVLFHLDSHILQLKTI